MPSRKILVLKRILIFAISISALILLLFIARFADPRVEFKDNGLEYAVRDALDNKYMPIVKNDLLGITILDASNRGITRLDGIEYFQNLVSLDLEGNSIEDISPLKDLKNLIDLNLGNNSITDLKKINFSSINIGFYLASAKNRNA